LVISFDGLGYGSISKDLTPNLFEIAQNGSHLTHGILSQVATVTAPNYQSLSTGKYEESHGIIGNVMFDPVLNKTYDVWNFGNDTEVSNQSLDAEWYEAESIWATYQNQMKNVCGLMRWPMGNVRFPHFNQSRTRTWETYGNATEWQIDLDELLGWFLSGEIDFGMMYISQPDEAQHHNDLNSSVVLSNITSLDRLVGHLVVRLKQADLWGKVDVIFTADHGHEPVDLTGDLADKNLVVLDEILGETVERSLVRSSYSYFLKPNCTVPVEDIYRTLKQAVDNKSLPMHVWLKDDFPVKYHWKNSQRVGPLIIIPKKGAHVARRNRTAQLLKLGNQTKFGDHGFLNDEVDSMRPFFIATGPSFKKPYRSDRTDVENVDIYLIMCAILGISPQPNNGSLERVRALLEPDVLSKFEKISRLPPNSFTKELSNMATVSRLSLVTLSIVVIIPLVSVAVWLMATCKCLDVSRRSQSEPLYVPLVSMEM